MIAGLVPCSFIDYPGMPAAVVFLQGCNLRCPYCHNPDLVGNTAAQPVSESSLFELLQRRKSKLSAVVVSGGEPTLYAGLDDLLRRIQRCGYRIKLDTNGTRPEVLKRLIEARLVDYVALDIKDIPAHYGQWLGADHVGPAIEDSLQIVQSANLPHEYRTTLIEERHSVDTLLAMHEFINDGSPWFLQRAQPGRTLRPAAWHAISSHHLQQLIGELRAHGVRSVNARESLGAAGGRRADHGIQSREAALASVDSDTRRHSMARAYRLNNARVALSESVRISAERNRT